MNYEIKQRDMGILVLLSVVTLFVYDIFLIFTWTKDINHLLKSEKYNSTVVLIVGIVTCTLAFTVWQVLYAYDLQKIAADRDAPGRNGSLGSFVLILIIASFAVSLLSGGLGIIGSIALVLWSFCLMQKELNILAEQELQQQHVTDG